MESQSCVVLGIKVKPGPIERFKIENFTLDNTVITLKGEAEKKANLPSSSLELIHHGKILKDHVTLQDSGVKSGEMVHVVKKKELAPPTPPPTFTDAELQQLNSSLRTLGCTPNAPGWTRAMQLLNDESAMAEIMEHAPSLNDNCVTLSILHEVELLAALGSNLQTMRRGAAAHPHLVMALRHLMRLVRSRTSSASTDNAPTSGFAYSLEALSEDEDAEEEEPEERPLITQEQVAEAIQAAAEAALSRSVEGSGAEGGAGAAGGAGAGGRHDGLLRLLAAAGEPAARNQPPATGASRPIITPEMFSEAITDAINRTGASTSGTPVEQTPATPMEQSITASSSSSPSASPLGRAASGPFKQQLDAMHELGLFDDTVNVRALLVCGGDVNQAINLVFSGVIGDDTT